jgi:hypothetical protein
MIKERQQKAVVALVDKLGANQVDEEANMNASMILCDVMDTKDYFNALSKKATQQKLFDIIHAQTFDKNSKCAGMVVLTKYIESHFKNEHEHDNDSEKGGEEDDDIIIKNESDSEEEKSGDKEQAFFESLAAHIEPLKSLLKYEPEEEQLSPLNGEAFKPLGVVRLRAVELLC